MKKISPPSNENILSPLRPTGAQILQEGFPPERAVSPVAYGGRHSCRRSGSPTPYSPFSSQQPTVMHSQSKVGTRKVWNDH